MTSKPIDVEFMRSLLEYDPDTGILTWKEREANSRVNKMLNTRYANKRAGSINIRKNPYPYISRRLVFTRNGKRTVYLEHRVVWAIHYGSDIPEGFQIDHINGDTCDNRIINLRLADNVDNARNTSIRSNSTSGVIGVNFVKQQQKWKARIKVRGTSIHLGLFTRKEDAIEARKKAEIEYSFHENHGREKT